MDSGSLIFYNSSHHSSVGCKANQMQVSASLSNMTNYKGFFGHIYFSDKRKLVKGLLFIAAINWQKVYHSLTVSNHFILDMVAVSPEPLPRTLGIRREHYQDGTWVHCGAPCTHIDVCQSIYWRSTPVLIIFLEEYDLLCFITYLFHSHMCKEK